MPKGLYNFYFYHQLFYYLRAILYCIYYFTCSAFKCRICLETASSPVYLDCCKVIGGCLACFECLTRNNPLVVCPNCREGRVIARFKEVRGLDDVLEGVKSVIPSTDIAGVNHDILLIHYDYANCINFMAIEIIYTRKTKSEKS